MSKGIDYHAILEIAIEEARSGPSEGRIPSGAALFDKNGALLGRGHNRLVQEYSPSVRGETSALQKAGRQRRYQETMMVTTPAKCERRRKLIVYDLTQRLRERGIE